MTGDELRLVDGVAEAMTGWPLDTTTAEDAEAWRANARAALAHLRAERLLREDDRLRERIEALCDEWEPQPFPAVMVRELREALDAEPSTASTTEGSAAERLAVFVDGQPMRQDEVDAYCWTKARDEDES